jgi:hypothetical protein
MASSRDSSHRLHDEPVSPLQLATHVMYNEEEVPNTKRMHIVEEVSLSQLEAAMVPQKEEEVLVPQGPCITILPEEEEFPAPAVMVPQGPPCHDPIGGRGGPSNPLVMVPPEGRGCLVPVPAMVSYSPFFFLKNRGDSSRSFSHKCGRFVGLELDLC